MPQLEPQLSYTPPTRPRGLKTRSAVASIVAVAAIVAASLVTLSPPAQAVGAPFHAVQSGRCLDAVGANASAGARVDIWDCNNQSNQQWDATSAGELRVMGGSLCLDTVGHGTAAGVYLNVEACNGASTQKWSVVNDGTIRSVQTGLCVDVDHAGTTNGTYVLLWYCNGQANQQWARTVGTTLKVDASVALHPVDRVGTGFLYGLADAATPSVSVVAPLKPIMFRQPPPGSQHIPNQETHPVGEALSVAPTVQALGSKQFVDMADIFTGFPYNWSSWNDWYAKIDAMTAEAVNSGYYGTITSWEPWNEPDWTWPSAAGSFTDGWSRSVVRIKQTIPNAVILGPSPSLWNEAYMRNFLTAAKASGTVPDIICWHELSGPNDVGAHIAAYRALESQLGISPRPISIDEYGTPSEIDVPAMANKYIAQFERAGVHDAERAFWYEAGTLNGLLYGGSPTASYWMYKWYADQTGDIVKVTPSGGNTIDGVAAVNNSTHTFSVVFGGAAGTSNVEVTGLSNFGSSVTVTVSSVPASGRKTNVSGATLVSSQVMTLQGGAITVSVPNMVAGSAYNIVIKSS